MLLRLGRSAATQHKFKQPFANLPASRLATFGLQSREIMSGVKEEALDAVTEEEMNGIAPAAEPKNNAFQELMSPKKKQKQHDSALLSKGDRPTNGKVTKILSTEEQRMLNYTHGRGALAVYTTSPTSFPPTRVLSYTDDFVVINDLYPKSSVHLLLLPRDKSKQLLHPFDALDGSDPAFLAAVKAEATKLRALATAELQRRYGRFSAQDAKRNAILDGDDSGEGERESRGNEAGTQTLPPGRDWSVDIMCGVHAVPSMEHLHIHVLSVDRVNECVRHRKHYNSFATPFLVPVDDFPLAQDDPRRRPDRQGYLDRDLKCWRCGQNFGNKFAKLKAHLDEEFEVWKRL